MKKLISLLLLTTSMTLLAYDGDDGQGVGVDDSIRDYCTYRFDVDMNKYTQKDHAHFLNSHGFKFDPASPYKLEVKKQKPNETFLSKLNPITALSDAVGNIGIASCDPDYDLQQQQCFSKTNSGTFIHTTDYIINDGDGENIAKLRQKGKNKVMGYQAYGYEVLESKIISQKCITLKH